MNNIELYIQDSNKDYVQVDLFDNENISVVDSIQDTRDIKKLYNLFTRDFNVPASFSNNKTFKHYYNSSITNGFDARLKTKALIKVGGADFKVGLLKMIGTKLKNNKIESYKVSFQGETISLSDKLQKKEIGDLDFDNLLFSNDEPTRVAAIKRGLYGGTPKNIGTVEQDSAGNDLYPDVILAPIFKGKVVAVPYGPNFSSGNTTITDNNYDFALVVYTGYGPSKVSNNTNPANDFGNQAVTSFDFKPSVKVGKLLQMANEQYDLGLQESFYQREELDQMYMVFNGDQKPSSQLNDSYSAFNINDSSSKSIENIVERVVYTTETTPTHPLGAKSLVEDLTPVKNIMNTVGAANRCAGLINIYSNTSDESISIIARKFYLKNGQREILKEETFSNSETGTFNLIEGIDTGTTYVLNDALIEFEFEVVSSGTLGNKLQITFEYGKASSNTTTIAYYNYAVQTIQSFAYLQIKPFAPKIKILDMLIGIFKMLNMTAYVEDGQVIIKKLSEYYNLGNEYDITQYVDTKSASIAPGTTYRNISMKYEDADDVMTKSYIGVDSDITFGGHKINKSDFISGSDDESKDGKDYEIELPFQRMMFERLSLAFDDNQVLQNSYSESAGGLSTDMVIGNQIDEKLQAVTTKPILFYGKKVDTSATFASGGFEPTGITGIEGRNNADGTIEYGNTAGVIGSNYIGSGLRNLVITTKGTNESSNDNGLTTLVKSDNNDDYLNTWWIPSGIMASRLRRNGELINYNGKIQGLSFDNNDSDEFEYNMSKLLEPSAWINGLYQANYEEYIESIYLESARIEKYNVVLPQSIINNYKLNDSVIVGTNLYNINKINVNLLNGKGTIELINKIAMINTNQPTTSGELAAAGITGLNLLPSAGEYLYNTSIVTKTFSAGTIYEVVEDINNNTGTGVSDAIVSLDNMQREFPNLDSLSVIVTWYGDTDDDTMNILPRQDASDGGPVFSATWNVGSYTRANTPYATMNGDIANVGGTPGDLGLIEFITEVKARGIKVMLYPFLQSDTVGKGWRGMIPFDGTQASLDTWFDKYTLFIRHYSQLFAGTGLVDKFMIGTELVSLTRLRIAGEYEGVNKLVELAGDVRTDFGSDNVKLSYGANWDEYHSHDGNYNMDVLWTDSNIDEVGIDNYFPATDFQDPSTITYQDIYDGYESGEGWDHYYSVYNDSSSKVAYDVPGGEFAWKNVFGWWNRNHFTGTASNILVNGDMSSVAWPWNYGSWSYMTPTTDGSIATLTLDGTFPTDYPRIEQTFATTIGEDYTVTGLVDSNGNPMQLLVVEDSTYTFIDSVEATTTGYETMTFTFTATSTSTILQILVKGTAGDVAYVDNMEVIEVGGAPSTGWTSQMKPLFFSEYGFASVYGTTNQPNVFAPALPRLSNGTTDLEIMRQSLIAFNNYWDDKTVGVTGFAEERYAWAYDMRPYPQFPHSKIWIDWDKWEKGHWLNGKLN